MIRVLWAVWISVACLAIGLGIGVYAFRQPAEKQIAAYTIEHTDVVSHAGTVIRIATESESIKNLRTVEHIVYLPGGRIEVDRTIAATEKTETKSSDDRTESTDTHAVTETKHETKTTVTVYRSPWSVGPAIFYNFHEAAYGLVLTRDVGALRFTVAAASSGVHLAPSPTVMASVGLRF